MLKSGMESFEKLSSASVSGLIPLEKYHSKETGLTVYIANVEGPLVNGYFGVATEAHDDDGLPHTLEHLVLMGSDEYPYKGMLDLFANRCLSQGANAWTDTDHTCYTLTTAGSEGFLNLLPIYLDHLLYPTLTKSSYITEVHHVNGKGEDAGVVYCEMQARENTSYCKAQLELIRNIYPGVCGYKSETGGILKNLRTTCSHEKVCDYHRDFYRPENLCLIITGQVDAAEVFRRIAPFEEKIKSKGARPPYVRPWQSDVPSMSGGPDIVVNIEFPSEDDSTGLVLMGWRGPDVTELYKMTALRMLFTYLTDTSVAPLQQELVEIDDPLCSDVSFVVLENKVSCIFLHLESVPTECLHEVAGKVNEVLDGISSGVVRFDMDRLRSVIHRDLLGLMSMLEDQAHETIAMLAIGDFIYSKSHDQIQNHVSKIERMKQLQTEDELFWIDLMNEYLGSKQKVIVVTSPNEELMSKIAEEERQRVQERVETLGEEGLKLKSEELEKAMLENERSPPADVVQKMSIPSTDSISFHSFKSFTNRSPQSAAVPESLKFPLDGFPAAFSVYHTKTLFAQFVLLIDTASVPDNLRLYLPLYSEILFQSPILRNGQVIPYEDVVKELAADTFETHATIGIVGDRFRPGPYNKLLTLVFKLETEKYEKGVLWLRDILFNVRFSPDRLKVVANKMLNAVANFKRSGRKVVHSLLASILYTQESNFHMCNVVRQNMFLTDLVKKLDNDGADQILSDLEALRRCLLQPEKMRFYVASNVDSLPNNPDLVWREHVFAGMAYGLDRMVPVKADHEFSSNVSKRFIVGIGAVDSAFLVESCPGITSFSHPDYPAMLVFIEYLCACEGPFWRQLRGQGLTYNYMMVVMPSSGNLFFILAMSTHIFDAHVKAKEIMESYLTGAVQFEHDKLEAARSGVIFQTISKEQSVGEAAFQEMVAEFRGTDSRFNRSLLKRISMVTAEDLTRVGKLYFERLLDISSTAMAICCHPSKVEEISQAFLGAGVHLTVLSSLDEAFVS